MLGSDAVQGKNGLRPLPHPSEGEPHLPRHAPRLPKPPFHKRQHYTRRRKATEATASPRRASVSSRRGSHSHPLLSTRNYVALGARVVNPKRVIMTPKSSPVATAGRRDT